jgi:hypothetical protein
MSLSIAKTIFQLLKRFSITLGYERCLHYSANIEGPVV